MYYVGVDIAKEKHYVCILDDTKELACKPFWIYSDILGLRELLKRLTELSLDMDDFIIGIESTGAFSENFYSYITDADYKVILLNSALYCVIFLLIFDPSILSLNFTLRE